MKKIMILIAAVAMTFASCRKDELDSKSIFADVPVLDSTAYNFEFESWLYDNYLVPFNVKFQYLLPDGSTDVDYNLVPVTFTVAKKTAYAIKYLWMDAYRVQLQRAGYPRFVQLYTPRIINAIGSPAINAAQGTWTLGVAEGGVKITLYNMNSIDYKNINWLNTYIFHVMHHEFSHILHQNKSFPKEYEQLSAGKYDTQGWQYHTDEEAYAQGFVTPYSMSEAHEDFVEVISSYITDTRERWEERGFTMSADHTHIEKIDDKKWPEGTPVMATKITMAKDWLLEKYGFRLDSIRAEVQRRQDAMIADPDTVYRYCGVEILK